MSERSNFEQEWRSSFENAEEQPRTSVWSEIKAELATMEADKQKGQVVYWRWVGVAASVLALLTIGLFAYEKLGNRPETTSNNITLNDNDISKKQSSDFKSESLEAKGKNEAVQITTTSEPASNSVEPKGGVSNNQKTNTIDEPIGSSKHGKTSINEPEYPNGLDEEKIENDNDSNLLINDDKFALSDKLSEYEGYITLLAPIDSVGTLAMLNNNIYLQRVPDLAELFKYKTKKAYTNMWAGLSMGGGSFNPNAGSSSVAGALYRADAESDINGATSFDQVNYYHKAISTNQATESPDFSYNFSVDFGKQLSRRFLIESGVEYAKYSSQANSNLTLNKNQQPEAFLRDSSPDFSYSDLQTTSVYHLQNSLEYVSIPVSFGYVVLDKKLGILIASGIATNFFLNNTLVDKSGQYETVTQKNSTDSPYRPINFNALLGGEIYYALNKNYVISIDPGYRISLTDITKTSANFSSHPTSFFVGLKFKYIL